MKTFLTVFLTVFLTAFLIVGATAEAGQIVATGRGVDQPSALRAALRQAIETEIGVIVKSNTRTKNYQLVETEIIADSNGFINHYKIINERVENGIYFVTVNADVRSDELRTEFLSRLQKKSIVENNMNDPRIKVRAVDQDGNELLDVENDFIAALRSQGFNRMVERAEDADFIADISVNERAISARLIAVDSGEIICANTFDNVRRMFTDTRRWTINNAARMLAQAALNHAAQLEQHVTILLSRHNGDQVMQVLQSITGVNDVFRRSLTEFDVNFDGTASDLATALERAGIAILELSSSTIKI